MNAALASTPFLLCALCVLCDLCVNPSCDKRRCPRAVRFPMQARLATGVAIALTLPGCGSAHHDAKPAPDLYPAAYEAGRREAEAELAEGNVHWLRVPEAG